MYLIQYELTVGSNRHYAASASAAVRMIREIRASGGRTVSISRTRDDRALNFEELELLAAKEVGPPDERPATLIAMLRRLLSGRRQR